MNDVLTLALTVVIGIIFYKLWKIIIFPKILNATTEIVEENPKWITPKLRQMYYGFSDVDILTVRSSVGVLPRFRVVKKDNKQRLELLIPEDTSTNDIDEIAKIVLRSKLYVQYGITPSDKPTYWLSILLYMLDGGSVRISDVDSKNKLTSDKKPVDDAK